ncbi:hypothetical protein AAF712_015641 [Marasmius tenuissimus]|uniref:C2H2-type domain-containing protein n=1 Tax=Marasmius tenuissimus TaxID=585030 RepID=A0ABR2Z7P9_9AGAR
MCCELAHAADVFIGSWRASVKHFEDFGHHSLSRADLANPSKLFRLATAVKVDKYMEVDTAQDWCCSHCHESLDKKLTHGETVLHLKQIHLVPDPKFPKDMFYGGV